VYRKRVSGVACLWVVVAFVILLQELESGHADDVVLHDVSVLQCSFR
jgi:hypothetical protein